MLGPASSDGGAALKSPIAALSLLLTLAPASCHAPSHEQRHEPARAGTPGLPDVRRRSSSDAPAALADGAPSGLAVLLFVARECPIANAYAPELARLADRYGARGVAFLLVYSDVDDDLAAVRDHVRGFGLALPAVLDPSQELAHAVGATVTPEAALVDRAGALLYRGRVDDRYLDYGVARRRPERRDLAEALDAALAGEPVRSPRTEPVGCFLPEPWPEDAR